MSLSSRVQTGASLVIKVVLPSGEERAIGFCTSLNFAAINGQKVYYGVDSPFPVTINQAAAPSYVRGTLNVFLIKTSTLESCGLVPYRTDQVDKGGNIYNAAVKPIHIRLYDRDSTALVYSLEYLKVSHYNISIQTKSVVQASLSFEGFYCTPGPAY